MAAEVEERPVAESQNGARRLLLERVVGGAALAGGLALIVAGARYGLSSDNGVGPGTFPAASGALLVLSSVLQVRNLLPQRDAATEDDRSVEAEDASSMPDRGGVLRVAVVLAATVAAALVLDRVGFVITVGLYLAAVLKYVGHRSWLRSVVVGLLVALVIGEVFSRALGVNLPTTSIEFLANLGI